MGIIGVALAQNAQTAKEIILRFTCEATALPGDLVYQDQSNAKKVLVNTDNALTEQTIGVIKEKPGPTDANVLILGILPGFTGLTISGRIFLGTSGGITQTIPTTGYVHNLGLAVSETEILFIPSNERVKRN